MKKANALAKRSLKYLESEYEKIEKKYCKLNKEIARGRHSGKHLRKLQNTNDRRLTEMTTLMKLIRSKKQTQPKQRFAKAA